MLEGARQRGLLVSLLVVASAVMAFYPAIRSGYIWDDDDYVTENRNLHDLSGLRNIWFEVGAIPQYYPLVHTTFWVEHKIWGLNPQGYHTVNVLLHAFSALLFWRILVLLGVPGALFAACAFALHPVHVESVAWITERKNVLSGFFYLASAAVYLNAEFSKSDRSPEREGPPGAPLGKAAAYWIAFLFYVCALLSKTVTCTLPVAILLVLYWKRGRVKASDARRLVPFFCVGLALGLVTVWVEKAVVGAVGLDWDYTLWERCLIAGRVVWFYLGKLAVPTNLTFFYPQWTIDANSLFQWAFPIACLGAVLTLFVLRERTGRGPLVAFLFFVVSLFPALGFFDVYPMRYSFVADHFQYLASLGPIALVAAIGARSPVASPVRRVAAAAVLAVLAGSTFRQCGDYKDLDTLWTATIRKNPRAWMAYNNLGMNQMNRGDLDAAEENFRKSLAGKEKQAEAHHNLGLLAVRRSDMETAVARFRTATEVDPTHRPPFLNLGNAYLSTGRYAEAAEAYRGALVLREGWLVRYNLGSALLEAGSPALAIPHLEECVRLHPAMPEGRNNLGLALEEEGEFGSAIGAFSAAVQLAPQNSAFRENLHRVRKKAATARKKERGTAKPEGRKEPNSPRPGR